jgi:hypothetical protein
MCHSPEVVPEEKDESKHGRPAYGFRVGDLFRSLTQHHSSVFDRKSASPPHLCRSFFFFKNSSSSLIPQSFEPINP